MIFVGAGEARAHKNHYGSTNGKTGFIGLDERDDYGDGWCEQGQRFEASKSGRRGTRINMIASRVEFASNWP